MTLLDSLVQRSTAERIVQLERLDKGVTIEGEFEGSVSGVWIRFAEDGTGIVSYNKKEYATKPIGITSLPYGSIVELSYADGIYYSKF